MNLGSSVTISINGHDYELINSLETRKGLCVKMGGIRPALEAVAQFNEWSMALIIAIASGTKKVEPVFEDVCRHGALKVATALSDWTATLLDDGSEDDEGNDPAATSAA